MSFSLKLFGGVAITGEQGPVTGPAVQRHRLALLAVLASAHPGALSRDKLLALLWPERDVERGRALLNQAVYALRQALGAEAVLSTGDELSLDGDQVRSDLADFEAALRSGEAERAVTLYRGPFLDGFFLSEAPEFDRWADQERSRLAAAYARVVEGLAESAERDGNAAKAEEWWNTLAVHHPYDSRIALRLMQAMERAGNRGGALQHGLAHARRLREDLEIEPSAELLTALERLRTESVGPLPGAMTASEVVVSSGDGPDMSAGRAASPATGVDRWLARYVTAAVLLVVVVGMGLWLMRGREQPRPVTAPGVDEIAQAVARELALRERGDTAHRSPEFRTRSLPAYELFLRGNDPTLLRNDSTARLGLEYLEQAVALDPTYAAAWAGVARMTLRVSKPGPAFQAEAQAKAEVVVRKALALDDSLAEAHALLGVMRSRRYDFPGAEEHLNRAIALEPTRARHHEWLSNIYLFSGRPRDALTEAERAAALEPVSASANAELARALLANDRCDEALERLGRLSGLTPPLLRVASIEATCRARQGRYAEAIQLLGKPPGPADPRIQALFGYMLGRAGRREEALEIQRQIEARWQRGEAGAVDLAYVPAALGDRDQAFAWLDRAVDDRSIGFNLAWPAGLEGPPFSDLKDDARFARFLTRMGLQNR